MRRSALVGAAVGIALVILAAAVAFVTVFRGDDSAGPDGDSPKLEVVETDDDEVDHDFVIPLGTEARRLAGEAVEIMPETLDVKVGESIRVRNLDTTGAYAGIFYVGPGEVVSMRFTTPGTLSGECDLNAGGEFTVNVRERA